MKVLVTGADGMLSQELMPALEQAGHEAVGIDHADADVSQPGSLDHALRTFEPDWVFHLAAFTRVDECEAKADHAYAVNALGSRNVALAAQACGAALLAISTDYVFGGRADKPFREYDAVAPQSVYGASKWAGEQAIREVYARHLVVRTAWMYGRGGANFVDTVLHRARSGEPLRVVDDQRGSPTWTGDLAPALIRLAASGQFGTYHVTNAGDCTWWELASYVVQHAGLEVAVGKTTTAELGRPAPRPPYSVLHNQMYERVTGERMPHWQDAIDRYLTTRARE